MMANAPQNAGKEARQKLGWFYSHRFLLLRRLTQISILLMFLYGSLFGRWILKGNYSSSQLMLNFPESQSSTAVQQQPVIESLTIAPAFSEGLPIDPMASSPVVEKSSLPIESIPMTDPLLLLQSLLTGHWPELTALLGAVIVVLFYAVLAGKLFCSWVCPFNLVTDLAAWLRRKLHIPSKFNLHPSIRYFVLIGVLLASAISGVIVWEWMNPVSTLGRGMIGAAWEYGHQVSLGSALMIGFGAGIWLLLAIFILDLFVFKHGWCGHLCPIGAFYGIIGSKGLMHIDANKREACTKCMDCINVCPEAQVLPKPLFAKQESTFILSQECVRCGRCIDVCPEKVFSIKLKFKQSKG